MLLMYTKKGRGQEIMLGGRGFVGQAKDFELNLRYNEWSLTQIMFLKERFGCCVENGLDGAEDGGGIMRNDVGVVQGGGTGDKEKWIDLR